MATLGPPPVLKNDEREKVRAIAAWQAQDEWQLDLYVDDIVTVLDKFEGNPDYEGWWSGQVENEIGLFPVSYTEPYQKRVFKQNEKNISSMIKQLQEQCGFFQQKGTSTVDSLHEEFEALQSELKGHTAANAKIVDAALFGGSGASTTAVPAPKLADATPAAVQSTNVPAPPPMAQATATSSSKSKEKSEALTKLKQEIAALTKKLTAAEEQAKQSSAKKEEEINSINKKLSEEETLTKKANEELEKQKERNSQLKEALDKEKHEIVLLKEEIDKHLREHARDAANIETLSKERDGLNVKIGQMQTKVSEQGQQVSALTVKNREFTAIIVQHESTQESLKQIIEKQKSKLEKAAMQVDVPASEIDESGTSEPRDPSDSLLPAKLGKTKQKLMQIRSQFSESQAVVTLLNAKVSNLEEAHDEALAKVKDEYESSNHALSYQLAQEKQKVQLLKQHLSEAEEGLTLKTTEISRIQTELRKHKNLFRDKCGEKDILELKFGVVSNEFEESEKKNAALKKKLKKVTEQTKKDSDTIDKLTGEKEVIKEQLDSLKRKAHKKGETIRTLKDENSELKKGMTELHKTVEQAKASANTAEKDSEVELARAKLASDQMMKMLSMARDTQEHMERQIADANATAGRKTGLFHKGKPPARKVEAPVPPPQTQSKIKQLEEQIAEHSQMVTKLIQERETLFTMNKALMDQMRETLVKLRTLEAQQNQHGSSSYQFTSAEDSEAMPRLPPPPPGPAAAAKLNLAALQEGSNASSPAESPSTSTSSCAPKSSTEKSSPTSPKKHAKSRSNSHRTLSGASVLHSVDDSLSGGDHKDSKEKTAEKRRTFKRRASLGTGSKSKVEKGDVHRERFESGHKRSFSRTDSEGSKPSNEVESLKLLAAEDLTMKLANISAEKKKEGGSLSSRTKTQRSYSTAHDRSTLHDKRPRKPKKHGKERRVRCVKRA